MLCANKRKHDGGFVCLITRESLFENEDILEASPTCRKVLRRIGVRKRNFVRRLSFLLFWGLGGCGAFPRRNRFQGFSLDFLFEVGAVWQTRALTDFLARSLGGAQQIPFFPFLPRGLKFSRRMRALVGQLRMKGKPGPKGRRWSLEYLLCLFEIVFAMYLSDDLVKYMGEQ